MSPELAPGDLVICDNLASHKSKRSPKSSRPAGHLLYLAAYSPDLNPIGLAFAKLKTALRQTARRSFDGMIDPLAGRSSPPSVSPLFSIGSDDFENTH